ncbi:MAG TPA: Holliday junction branch migration protein RuvA [Gemmatimonadales bacterium]|nr:Holliday junction branch migration protein RuvA [Gemmatimonadales bacterium]
MIAGVRGTLEGVELDVATIETAGGVSYEVLVPLGVLGRLPAPGNPVRLYTELVVREDNWLLVGFDTAHERLVFRRLLTASGFGPRLALALLSTLGPDRAVRAILGNDLAALGSVSGIGKKKAERLVLELRDRFKDLPTAAGPATVRPDQASVSALLGLGYSAAAAEDAVRAVLTDGVTEDTSLIVRRALQRLTAGKGGSST